MAKLALTPEVLALVAERFKVLAEPARLELLNTLRGGDATVGELVDATGMGQANVSKHLQLLFNTNFVTRRKEGLFVYYSLTDRAVFQLCDLMCARLEAESVARRRVLAGR